jgi:hypothetical protein
MTPVAQLPLTLGQQLHLAGDPNPWHVSAVSEHFAMLCRRFAGTLAGTGRWPEIIYTVIDWRQGVRGVCDALPDEAPHTQAECAALLTRFESGELKVSSRYRVPTGELAP